MVRHRFGYHYGMECGQDQPRNCMDRHHDFRDNQPEQRKDRSHQWLDTAPHPYNIQLVRHPVEPDGKLEFHQIRQHNCGQCSQNGCHQWLD